MPIYAAQVTLQMSTNINADAVVNTFHFSGTNIATDPTVITSLLTDYYDDLVGIYGLDVRQDDHSIKVYSLDDPKPRAPLLESVYDFPSAPATSTLPHELAICASFQGPKVSGEPQARKRGRVYLGPLRTTAVAAGGFVSPTPIATIVTATEALLAAAIPSDVSWGVYSTVDDDLYQITNGWVDNAFDVQRRRGTSASTRNVWS